MTTYADVKKQIAQLEKKAADLRKVEVAKAVANIREQMAKYELTVDDIAPGKSSKGGKPAARSAKVKVATPAKYMDPKTGKTWTGHGKAPAWIALATKKGRRDDFLIEIVTQTKGTKPVESTTSKTPVTASKSAGGPKKVVPKKQKAVANKKVVAKKAVPASKNPTPAIKAKAEAPAKKTAKKTPVKLVAKPKANIKVAIKSAGVTKPPKRVAGKPSATQAQSAAASPPTAS